MYPILNYLCQMRFKSLLLQFLEKLKKFNEYCAIFVIVLGCVFVNLHMNIKLKIVRSKINNNNNNNNNK